MATAVLCVSPSVSEAQDRFGINVFGVAAHYGSPFYLDDNGVLRRYQWLEPGITFSDSVPANITTAMPSTARSSPHLARMAGAVAPAWLGMFTHNMADLPKPQVLERREPETRPRLAPHSRPLVGPADT
jgi:hypothetical protein